jgi:predicted nucleotidyltransferase
MDLLEQSVLLGDANALQEEDVGELKDIALMICSGKLTEAFEWIKSQPLFNSEDLKNVDNIKGA